MVSFTSLRSSLSPSSPSHTGTQASSVKRHLHHSRFLVYSDLLVYFRNEEDSDSKNYSKEDDHSPKLHHEESDVNFDREQATIPRKGDRKLHEGASLDQILEDEIDRMSSKTRAHK
jgi:hypothetical protein